MKVYIVYLFIYLMSQNASAGSTAGTYFSSKTGTFSLYANYTTYMDIQHSNASTSAVVLPAEYNFHGDIRLMRIFVLKTIGGTTVDNTKFFYGLGVKVDLPGFFFLGASINDLIHKRRSNPVNTYVEWATVFYDPKDGSNATSANRFGFGTDIFLINRLFLNVSVTVMSLQSNLFVSPAAGLGWEF